MSTNFEKTKNVKNGQNPNNNVDIKKQKEQKFHYYNNDYEEYTDVMFILI